MPRTNHWLLRGLRHVDGILLLLLVLVLGISLAVVTSASGQSPARISGHLVNMGLALAVMLLMANVPPHLLSKAGPPLYAAGLVLLLGVALFGEIRNGARRWLDLGFMAFQPSELLKLALPLMLAWYFQRNEAVLRARHFMIGGVMLLVPFLLILRQPDLGTALMLGVSGFYLLFFAGLPWKVILGGAVLGAASLPVAWGLMHDYQQKRVLMLLDPASDPLGAGYHIIQSTIAIGSGGLFGKGWMQGTQNQLDFIPERTTDFIYAVFGEEFGYVGTVLLVCLYLAIIARGLVIAARAPTQFGRLMAATLSLNLFTYVFVNMGMVSGILPVVGVPLPLMSYGGTALITLLLGMGILMSVATHRQLNKS
ncbi:MAG: rod shape-determining protein RodA [Thiobacillus sp. 63-78]|uniref:rod shape-determining protein RodA n=1 Tax=Thiobacillus sp. 63-78 TaxID=1895859 RepID=UPI00086A840C|nr:rod shape-determining protein RodA [Thiobacillus sp. 63-78]MBN8763250.1 rod shape-determining protein RodA [Thiobacillus sp.]ODV10064.1 MAG: rod shape-determining protein RodA [Thiobacillus sp. SCN 64-317]MBN8764966.1 rod shape-determining protein RodA [Thiobacillus sp.]MBN8773006.1 rod shape-determining protein RodA [Thiobacillus sp.]OJZ14896.1 MAG: rod shape-determining protein RodA [Thiobacillus sp. 63-78]